MTDTEKTEIDGLRALIAKVTDNPSTLVFPTDRWGFTSAVRKEVLKAASSVRGFEDKHDLLLGTLMVLITHVKMRKEKDRQEAAIRMQRFNAAHEERLPREQFSAKPRSE